MLNSLETQIISLVHSYRVSETFSINNFPKLNYFWELLLKQLKFFNKFFILQTAKLKRKNLKTITDNSALLSTAAAEVLTLINSFIEGVIDTPENTGDFFFIIWEIDPISIELFLIAICCAPFYYNEDSFSTANDIFNELYEMRQNFQIQFEKSFNFYLKNQIKNKIHVKKTKSQLLKILLLKKM